MLALKLFAGMPSRKIIDKIMQRYSQQQQNDKLKLVVETTADYKKTGIYTASRDDVSKPMIIDWGDGVVEEIDGDISQKVHEYTDISAFNVTIENIKSYAASAMEGLQWISTTSQNAYTLKEVVAMPDNMTNVNDYAFTDCSSLTRAVAPNNATEIGNAAFFKCSNLTSITIPNSVETMYAYAFDKCNSSLYDTTTIPGVMLVDGWAVDYTDQIASILDLTKARGIANDAFMQCESITKVVLPNNIKHIGASTFESCISLTDITIPGSVMSIEQYAFYDCSDLAEVSIPNSVTSIGNYAFSECISLASIIIPSSVTSIDDYAFSRCSDLAHITCNAAIAPVVRQYTFGHSKTTYTGRSSYSSGENVLQVPIGATGYDQGAWIDTLQDQSKCGFTIEYV